MQPCGEGPRTDQQKTVRRPPGPGDPTQRHPHHRHRTLEHQAGRDAGRRRSAAEAAPRMRRGFRDGAVGRAAGLGRRWYGRAPTTKWVVVLVAEDHAQISSGRVWPTAPHAAAEVLGCRRCARVAAGGAGWRAGAGSMPGWTGRTARAGAGRGPDRHPLRWKGRTAVRGAGGPRQRRGPSQAEGGPRAGRGRGGSGRFYRENVRMKWQRPARSIVLHNSACLTS